MITKRERFSHNSWAHNDPSFVKGKRERNYLYINPLDAQNLSCTDGDSMEISNETGSVITIAALSDDLMPGTVALPHGWGHKEATGLSVANRTVGVNANLLAADGPENIEPYSGMAQFNGVSVSLRRVS